MVGQGGGYGKLRHNIALCHEYWAVDGDDEMAVGGKSSVSGDGDAASVSTEWQSLQEI